LGCSLLPNLSIIIVTYNASEDIAPCLQSIIRQRYHDAPIEIIIVDNASSDGTAEIVRERFPLVTLIQNQKNIGFAAAVNQGVAASTGNVLLLLNPDMEMSDDSLDTSISFLAQHPEIDILGCKLLNVDGTLQESCERFPSIAGNIFESFFLYHILRHSNLYRLRGFDYNTLREVDVIWGAFMLMRRQVFEKVGGFDEGYFMYAEEMDFCYQAKQKGFKIFFFPDVTVIHRFGLVASNRLQNRYINLHKGHLRFYRKHYSRPLQLTMSILRLTGIALRIVVYTLVGIFVFRKMFLMLAKYQAVALWRIIVD
jgi:GT2 family glycosyltransferase